MFSHNRKVLLRLINFGLISGIGMWVLLLIQGAQHLKQVSTSGEYLVQCGPFALTQVTKHAIRDGFTVSFSMEAGFVWYLLSWCLLGAFIGLVTLYLGHGLPKDNFP